MSFGKSRGGVYRGQNGNDDLAMTCVNLSPYFNSSQFWDQAIDSYELTSPEYKKELEEKIFNVYRDNAGKSLYNFDELRRLNGVNQGTPSDAKVRPNVFDLESIEHMQKIKSRFFKT
jgi:hypothetical protein